MPTIARIGPYRLYFVSHDLDEPPHVHVDRDAQSANFWLSSAALARNLGFSPKELRALQRIVQEHQQELLHAWNQFFGH